jgi:predicted nucleic acid-binding Zn ribbon protein
MLSAPALQFKGTGWYVTDYGKGGKLPAHSNGKSESKTESKTETKSESHSDAKPAPAASSEK